MTGRAAQHQHHTSCRNAPQAGSPAGTRDTSCPCLPAGLANGGRDGGLTLACGLAGVKRGDSEGLRALDRPKDVGALRLGESLRLRGESVVENACTGPTTETVKASQLRFPLRSNRSFENRLRRLFLRGAGGEGRSCEARPRGGYGRPSLAFSSRCWGTRESRDRPRLTESPRLARAISSSMRAESCAPSFSVGSFAWSGIARPPAVLHRQVLDQGRGASLDA